eukprot:953184-Rhodomonas_salina.1
MPGGTRVPGYPGRNSCQTSRLPWSSARPGYELPAIGVPGTGDGLSRCWGSLVPPFCTRVGTRVGA